MPPSRRLLIALAGVLLSATALHSAPQRPARPARPAPSPVPALRGRICYTRLQGTNYDLHVMKADGTNDRAVPNLPGKVNWLADWSPDGTELAFLSGPSIQRQDFGLYAIQPGGGDIRRLAQTEGMVGAPAWSRDGQSIYFVSDRIGSRHLLSAHPRDGKVTEVRHQLAPVMSPFFSPDGKQIAVTATPRQGDPEASQIYTSTLEGAALLKQTSGPGPSFGGQGAWSPDGQKIVFVSLDVPSKPPHLHVWNMATKEETHVLDLKLSPALPPEVARPGWSPDGRWLIVSHLGDGSRPALWRVSQDGRTQQRITPPDATCVSPAWSPL